VATQPRNIGRSSSVLAFALISGLCEEALRIQKGSKPNRMTWRAGPSDVPTITGKLCVGAILKRGAM